MNSTADFITKSQIPKPGIFHKKRLSGLAELLKTLAIYDPALDNKLIVLVEGGDPGRTQSKINQVAKGQAVGFVVSTRHNPEENAIYVYRLA